MLKHTKDFYLKFVLMFILFFFITTYSVTHKETISKEIEILTSGSAFFAKTATSKIFNLEQNKKPISNAETFTIEILIHQQINEIRKERGLSQLTWDPMLAKLAREHSLDMVEKKYFNHTNLEGESPKDRAEKLGIKTSRVINQKIYFGVGENLGFMPKGVVQNLGVLLIPEDIASAMVLEWMLSKPHKENILDPNYDFGGIGVVYDGRGNYLITHNFI